MWPKIVTDGKTAVLGAEGMDILLVSVTKQWAQLVIIHEEDLILIIVIVSFGVVATRDSSSGCHRSGSSSSSNSSSNSSRGSSSSSLAPVSDYTICVSSAEKACMRCCTAKRLCSAVWLVAGVATVLTLVIAAQIKLSLRETRTSQC